MKHIGRIDGYNCYQVRNRAEAAHQDDCVYITSAGDAYMMGTPVGSVDLTTGKVLSFELPERVRIAVKLYQARKMERAKKEEAPVKETPVKGAVATAATADDFFERINAEIDALLASVKPEEKKKQEEAFKYEFN